MTWLKFLDGKKTYIAVAILVALAIFGFWTARVSDVIAVAILAAALGFFGIRHAQQRTAKLLIESLADLKAGKPLDVQHVVGETLQIIGEEVGEGEQLTSEGGAQLPPATYKFPNSSNVGEDRE